MQTDEIRFAVRGPRNTIEQGKMFQPSLRLAKIMQFQQKIRKRIISIPSGYDVPVNAELYPRKDAPGKRIRSRSFNTKPVKQEQVQASPGPGYYNCDDVNSSFVSKRKLQIAKRTQATTRAGDDPAQSSDNSSSQEQEYDPHATPGPGQYDPYAVTAGSTRKKHPIKKKITVVRLTSYKSPGPGDYNVEAVKKARANRFAFSCSTQKMPDIKDEVPGPAMYYVRQNQIRSEVIEQNIRGYIGDFGTRQSRFKQKFIQSPNPGDYQLTPVKQSFKYSFPKERRFNMDRKESLPPIKQEEVQSKMIVPKPAFNASQPRFKEEEVEKADLFFERARRLADQKRKEEQRRRPTAAFIPGQERLLQEYSETPFPGYGQINNNWNKKSFNICYSNF